MDTSIDWLSFNKITLQAVNKIYGDTEFDAGKYSHTGHTFEVQRIKIYNSSDCTGYNTSYFILKKKSAKKI